MEGSLIPQRLYGIAYEHYSTRRAGFQYAVKPLSGRYQSIYQNLEALPISGVRFPLTLGRDYHSISVTWKFLISKRGKEAHP
jgi:hypothetical protein